MSKVDATPNVLIAHPEKQHAFQTAYSFQEGNIPFIFFTSLWSNSSHFPYNLIPYLPRQIRSYVRSELKKRSFPLLENSSVQSYGTLKTLSYLGRRAVNKMVLKHNFQLWHAKTFDQWAAKMIRRIQPKVFIGYETSSLETFYACKKYNSVCILDHAAQHYLGQAEIHRRYNITNHNSNSEIDNRKREELDLADIILTPSTYARQTFVANGVPEHKLITIPYGVDLNVFSPARETNRSNKLRLLFCGTASPGKGIAYIEHAIKKFHKLHTFVFAGPMTSELKTLIKRYPKTVLYVGYLQGRDLAMQYQQSDILLLPSLTDSFGLVVLEAMACGIPAIVSEHTGSKDLIRNGVNGWIIPVDNSHALIERIQWATSHRHELKEIGQRARAQAEKYSWERYRANIRAVYTNSISTNAN